MVVVVGPSGCGDDDGGGGADASGADPADGAAGSDASDGADGLPEGGLLVHYRADREVATEGDEVIEWRDLGPGAHHAVPLVGEAFTPPRAVTRTIAGRARPAISFAGAELIGCTEAACSGLVAADVVAASPLTILAVAELDPLDTGVAEHPLLSSPDEPGVDPAETTELYSRYPGGELDGIQLWMLSDGGGGSVQLESADIAWEPHLWLAVIDEDAARFEVDDLTADFVDATTASLEGLRLGINPQGNRTLDGVLFEVVLYDRVLDEDEIAQARASLMARWLTP